MINILSTNYRQFLCCLVTSLFLFGCLKSELHFDIQFKAINGLKIGANVIHGENTIGKVNNIDYDEQGHFSIGVTIEEPYKKLATKKSLFIVDGYDERFIRLISSRKRAENIQDGEAVNGSPRLKAYARALENKLHDTFDSLTASLDGALDELGTQTIEQRKEIEQEIDNLFLKFNQLTAEKKKTFNEEIIPSLKKKLRDLELSLKDKNVAKEIEIEVEKLNRKFEQFLSEFNS